MSITHKAEYKPAGCTYLRDW